MVKVEEREEEGDGSFFNSHCKFPSSPFAPGGGGGGGVLPYKRLMGMCRWMGLHFHDWSDYNGVAFSIELLEWGRIFSDFWGK